MKNWYNQRQEKRRMKRGHKNPREYTFGDFLLDLLLWIPELFLFPFRVIFWLVRGLGRLIGHIFDVV
ncbi:hypothetical protein JOC85_001016 [Bacillus mesophilus]|uniref:Uncharacterized protein n=1 Tax=Bacillus mesophilus TaxID=1808955 RepID=A0A6M0Q3K0_9BACI|nr:hypothetical protein [Bacillus mesophilus]MBM7660249.1 hypothetical protein [Bacillus mesophilus]NEY70966.1 hypothetical protein [Bacillus mesophilus]